jgi:hypothetical protein
VVNVLIHIATVWCISSSVVVFLLECTPDLANTPEWVTDNIARDIKVNIALVLTLIYAVVYLYMEPLIGFIGNILAEELGFVRSYCVPHSPSIIRGSDKQSQNTHFKVIGYACTCPVRTHTYLTV